jgi:hypothetical protein
MWVMKRHSNFLTSVFKWKDLLYAGKALKLIGSLS